MLLLPSLSTLFCLFCCTAGEVLGPLVPTSTHREDPIPIPVTIPDIIPLPFPFPFALPFPDKVRGKVPVAVAVPFSCVVSSEDLLEGMALIAPLISTSLTPSLSPSLFLSLLPLTRLISLLLHLFVAALYTHRHGSLLAVPFPAIITAKYPFPADADPCTLPLLPDSAERTVRTLWDPELLLELPATRIVPPPSCLPR